VPDRRSRARAAPQAAVTISTAGEADLVELVALMLAYCDFYDASPTEERLQALARTLIADPEREGVQLLARDDCERAVGFATLYWTWSTSRAAPVGTMNDLFVVPEARGRRVGERLLEACVARCAARRAVELQWQTAPSNKRAQALYDRVGGRREGWLSYSLEVADR
jgi:ribosomal protein S18 acetylase RimI-like enzyme